MYWWVFAASQLHINYNPHCQSWAFKWTTVLVRASSRGEETVCWLKYVWFYCNRRRYASFQLVRIWLFLVDLLRHCPKQVTNNLAGGKLVPCRAVDGTALQRCIFHMSNTALDLLVLTSGYWFLPLLPGKNQRGGTPYTAAYTCSSNMTSNCISWV